MFDFRGKGLGDFPSVYEFDMELQHIKTNRNINRLIDMLIDERTARIKAEKNNKIATIISITLGFISVILGFITFM